MFERSQVSSSSVSFRGANLAGDFWDACRNKLEHKSYLKRFDSNTFK